MHPSVDQFSSRSYDKDYLLVSKTSENDYNPEQILIDQVEVRLKDKLFAFGYQYNSLFQ